MRATLAIQAFGLVVAFFPLSIQAQAEGPQEVEFFERKIRPILVQHCYPCHSASAKKVKGGLFVDSRAGLLEGGDSGPALIPGKPDDSPLIQALRYDGRRMPPAGKLPEAILADFERWVTIGAPDPRVESSAATKSKVMDFEAARRHWAFQPLRPPLVPAVQDTGWPLSPLDHFILAKLEAHGLTPSPPADRRTLLRRVTYDLIGLPPTPAELEAVLADSSPNWFEKVVERLLASPHYGERWGRHWLDIARYADTKDIVLLYGDDSVRPYAYTYRDYVIRAWNADTPFDQFIHEQLAADKIAPPEEPWRLAALGFLTLGRLFDENPHDIYDDQIDVVTRGFLGLTVSCARCHDHKYDPIPTQDYYSLYGVFASSELPVDLPLIADPKERRGGLEFEQQLARKRAELQHHVDSQYEHITETARLRVADYLVKIATEKPDPLEEAVFYLSLSPDDLRPQFLTKWRRYLERRSSLEDPVFGLWHELMRLPANGFAEQARRFMDHRLTMPFSSQNPLVRDALANSPLRDRGDVARAYGTLFRQVYEESKRLPPARRSWSQQQLLNVLEGEDGPLHLPKSQTHLYMARVERDIYNKKLLELDRLAVKNPAAPPRAMVLVDSPQPYTPRVFLRGNPAQPGAVVPRQFLQVLTGPERQPFRHGSGRLELARAITAADNPLTARVLVNRVWMHHFGEPLVQTPSDFGTRSSPPTHPELLDYLAWTLQQDGWSLKRLHRRILLSRAYQQASLDRPACRQQDPDNRLLWRAHRRRLDFEAMRDTLLAISGRLDRALGGRSVDIASDPCNRRRTVYGKVDRQDLPSVFRAFDFAVPDTSVERRPQTTVPQQALFGLNAPFVIEQARSLATRPEVVSESDPDRRIAALYRLVFNRAPQTAEVSLAKQFLGQANEHQKQDQETTLTPWEQYAQVLLLTNELLFVD